MRTDESSPDIKHYTCSKNIPIDLCDRLTNSFHPVCPTDSRDRYRKAENHRRVPRSMRPCQGFFVLLCRERVVKVQQVLDGSCQSRHLMID
jgi:hypothetical protein